MSMKQTLLQFRSLLLMLCMMLSINTWAAELNETITFKDLGYTNSQSVESVTGTNVTLTLDKGSNTNNGPKYYNTGEGLRLYGGNTMTVTSTAEGYSIVSITFTYSGSGYTMGDATVSGGSYSTNGAVATWTGKASEFTITSAATCRLQKMEITLSNASAQAPVLNLEKSLILVGETTTITTNGPALTLSSSDPGIASISGTTITGAADGNATITATWSAGSIGGVSYSGGSMEFGIRVLEVEEGVFDFTLGYDYGSGYVAGSAANNSGTWTAGDVTMVTAGRNCWYQGQNFRLYAASGEVPVGTMTFNAPTGKVISSILFNSFNTNIGNIAADKGNYEVAGDNLSATWTGSANTVTFTATGTSAINSITVTCGVASSVATPVASIASGYYSGSVSFELSTETEGATIYYTTDGSTPTNASTTYTGAINVSSTTVVKAIAVKGGVSSDVMTLTVTIPTAVFNSIAALKTAAPTDFVILNLTNAQVQYRNSTTDLYVADESGALEFYKISSLPHNAGTILNGSIVVKYTVYKSMPEITAIYDNRLTATEGTITPIVVEADDVTLADYVGKLIKVKDEYSVDGDNKYAGTLLIYNKFGKTVPEVEAGTTIVVTGIVVPFNDGPELAIVSMKESLIELDVDVSNFTWVGTNVKGNYKFTLDTYAGAPTDPQFRLTLEPLDASQPAQFSAADLNDDNYWEPMFKYYTKMLAGEEMTAQNNIKRLYVNDVALLKDQFKDYANLKLIQFNLTSDYIIPDGCLAELDGHLDNLYIYSTGNMTLGDNIVPNDVPFHVYVETDALYQAWNTYKVNNGSAFIIDTPDAINSIEAEQSKTDDAIYDLSGRRISKTTKGIYIINGKKVVK